MAQAHGDRLSAVDASFLAQEGPASHMHVGATMIFEGPPPAYGDFLAHIRSRLRQWFGAAAADQCHVIYGGSVKPDNIHELILLPDVDGALVGGASLDIRAFGDIVARSRQSAV